MKNDRKKRIVNVRGEDFIYYVRRSRRAKNLLLRVDISGQVELVVPWWVSYGEAEKFINLQSRWLRQMIEKNEKKRRLIPCRELVSGERLLVFGEGYELNVVHDSLRQRARYSDGLGQVKVVVSEEDEVRKVLHRWYRKKAQEYFKQAVDCYCDKLSVSVLNLVVSGARSQWGSCIVKKKRISLSWRLALASREVADYVVAHEVAHMRERGHNSKFWKIVESLDADYKKHRKWLREYGYTLVL
jgi:predicted metal-dependent hydrolase